MQTTGKRLAAMVTGALALAAGLMPEMPAAAQQPAAAPVQTLDAIARHYFPSDDDHALPPKRLVRLTRDQLDATVLALLTRHAGSDPSADLANAAKKDDLLTHAGVKAGMPRDPLQTNYEYAEMLGLNDANIGSLTGWIGKIAAGVRKAPDLVIDCRSTGNTDPCVTEAARDFVVKAFRGDATPAEIKTFTDFFADRKKNAGIADAVGDLVEVVLNSPHFLFRRELTTVKGLLGSSGRLEPVQDLEAITYALADHPPASFDFQAVNAGDVLRDAAAAQKVVTSVLDAPEAREKLIRFFLAWLEIKAPGDFTIAPSVYTNFDAPLEAAMVHDAESFLREHLSGRTLSLKDVTQSRLVLSPALRAALAARQSATALANPAARKPTLVVHATRSPPQPTALSEPARFGIFAHPAVIASHSGPTDARPIKRGVFWVRKVMCMPMRPQPTDVDIAIKEIPGATERQSIEQSTRVKPCANCHDTINPFAFFQANYDALGRWRAKDETGAAIDASLLIDFLDDEAAIETKDPTTALGLLTNSMMFKQCFVRQLFRFYMARNEDAGDDRLLRQMFVTFTQGDRQDIGKTLQVLATSDRMLRRQ